MSFRFLYFPKLASNVMAIERQELEYHKIKVTQPHQLEREQLSSVRLSQISHLERTVIELRANKALSRKEKEMILTGAAILEEENIKNSYKLLSPERSNLRNLLRKAIGINDTNPLDDASRDKAVKAYEEFHAARVTFLNSIKTGQPLKTSTSSVFERLGRHPHQITNVMSKANPQMAQIIEDIPFVDKSELRHVEVVEKHAKFVTHLAHVVPKKSDKEEAEKNKFGNNFFNSFKKAIKHLRTQEEPMVDEKSSLRMSKS